MVSDCGRVPGSCRLPYPPRYQLVKLAWICPRCGATWRITESPAGARFWWRDLDSGPRGEDVEKRDDAPAEQLAAEEVADTWEKDGTLKRECVRLIRAAVAADHQIAELRRRITELTSQQDPLAAAKGVAADVLTSAAALVERDLAALTRGFSAELRRQAAAHKAVLAFEEDTAPRPCAHEPLRRTAPAPPGTLVECNACGAQLVVLAYEDDAVRLAPAELCRAPQEAGHSCALPKQGEVEFWHIWTCEKCNQKWRLYPGLKGWARI